MAAKTPREKRNYQTMTKAERMHWMFSFDALSMAEAEILKAVELRGQMPPEWHEIWENRDRRDPKKQRVTMRVDADVVKFFKAMGDGYQHRMNRVLRGFMHARLAKMVDGPDTTDFVLRPERVMQGVWKERKWGDFAERMGE